MADPAGPSGAAPRKRSVTEVLGSADAAGGGGEPLAKTNVGPADAGNTAESAPAAADAAKKPPPKKKGRMPPPGFFHRRKLPATCTPYDSVAGVRLFDAAHRAGCANSHFHLVAQFRTQDEPSYCGLGTLAMTLNALSIDPKRAWKGVWRWFDETLLDCCKSLEEVKTSGITLEEFVCLARCNGATADMFRPQLDNVDVATDGAITADTQKGKSGAAAATTTNNNNGDGGGGTAVAATPATSAAVAPGSIIIDTAAAGGSATSATGVSGQRSRAACCAGNGHKLFVSSSLDAFRAEVRRVSSQPVDAFEHALVVSYNRRTLGQSGGGHFSPVGAYDPVSDSLLILDVARFKYPPHWVPVPLVYEAMKSLDDSTGLPRGWVLVGALPASDSHPCLSVRPNSSEQQTKKKTSCCE